MEGAGSLEADVAAVETGAGDGTGAGGGASGAREGLLRSYLRINGSWQDHFLYALIADDPVVPAKD